MLDWAAREGRQIVTRDHKTMTSHVYDRVHKGLVMPGEFVLPERMPIGQAITELEISSLVSEPDDWQHLVIFLP